MPELKMGIDLTQTANKQKFAKALFGITQVMEGTQFYALFAMILSLHRQNKMTGIGQMFQYTLRDESNHIALGRYIFERAHQRESRHLDGGVPGTNWSNSCTKASTLEKEFVRDCLPEDTVGMTQKDFLDYVEFNADRRLTSLGLPALDREVESVPLAGRGDLPEEGKELLRDARDRIPDGRQREEHQRGRPDLKRRPPVL